MISEHWKIDSSLIKKANLNNIKGYKKDEGIALISVKNKELVPDWCNDKIKIFLSGCSFLKGDADCVVNRDGEDIVFLDINREGISVNNFDRLIDYVIYENYFEQKQPFFSKLPFKYTAMPVKLRVFLFNMLLKLKKDPGWPNWPAEKSVEAMRYMFVKALNLKLKKEIPYISFWPGHKFTFSVTHDCDTSTSFDNIESIREIERRHGINSSWNILSDRYKLDLRKIKKLKKLKKEGCEIGLHGYNHDNRTPFLKTKEIEYRISKASRMIKDFEIKGFRSPSFLRNRKFLDILSKHFHYDSSTCDTDLYSPVGMRSGACTIFPFFINNMVEIPSTLPSDWRLIRLGKNKNQIFNIWKEKVDFIEKAGGCAVMLTHPDNHIFGDEKYFDVYDRSLAYVTRKNSVWNALPYEIADWWVERRNSKIMNNKIIGSKRASVEKIV